MSPYTIEYSLSGVVSLVTLKLTKNSSKHETTEQLHCSRNQSTYMHTVLVDQVRNNRVIYKIFNFIRNALNSFKS